MAEGPQLAPNVFGQISLSFLSSTYKFPSTPTSKWADIVVCLAEKATYPMLHLKDRKFTNSDDLISWNYINRHTARLIVKIRLSEIFFIAFLSAGTDPK